MVCSPVYRMFLSYSCFRYSTGLLLATRQQLIATTATMMSSTRTIVTRNGHTVNAMRLS